MSLKDFLTKHYPTGLTDKLVNGEIKRLETEADRLEYEHWDSSAHTDAAKLLRNDIVVLREVRGRLIAGQSPLPAYNDRDEGYRKGALVISSGVIWQATRDFPTGDPRLGKGWTVLVGTPPPPPVAIPATIDMSVDLTKGRKFKTAEELETKEWLTAVEKRVKDELEAISFTEEQLKRAPSIRYLMVHSAGQSEAIQRAFKQRDATIDKLVKRIDELEAGGVRYHGVWQAAQEYTRGALVTYDGSMWHANDTTREQPGKSKAWTLAVKAGRDGKESK
ncbi:hypothetical protein [Phyllobacterium chamaecytisi]|uniref:hypothetical protein n=1 Tax=Phyllobacterium chamaecytisi TaxID=2876082 RepID=UPI001CCA5234|nr:hypothetical protein [Phyllobacterium sp. KW56]MBZ9603959.1 hypothetical protein [Phyllobacterium sp. KW56]